MGRESAASLGASSHTWTVDLLFFPVALSDPGHGILYSRSANRIGVLASDTSSASDSVLPFKIKSIVQCSAITGADTARIPPFV